MNKNNKKYLFTRAFLLVNACLLLFLLCGTGSAEAAFEYTAENIYGGLKKNYEKFRAHPEQIAKLMDSRSAKQYLAHLKNNKIKELPKIDILPSGIYIPTTKDKLEFVEMNLATAQIVWKVNGKQLVWKYKDDFTTRMKMYSNVFSRNASILDWILPQAHAEMDLPYTLKGTYIEDIIYISWYTFGYGDKKYIEIRDAKDAICNTSKEDILSGKVASNLVNEIRFFTHLQNKYNNDFASCTATQALQNCGIGCLDSNANVANSNLDCYALRDMQVCLAKLVDTRIPEVKKDILYQEIPRDCFFVKTTVANTSVDKINPYFEVIDTSYLSQINDRFRNDSLKRIDPKISLKNSCYTQPTTDLKLPAGGSR